LLREGYVPPSVLPFRLDKVFAGYVRIEDTKRNLSYEKASEEEFEVSEKAPTNNRSYGR